MHGECFVDFEQINVGDSHAGSLQGLLGAWYGSDTHHFGLDTRESETDHAHLCRQPEFAGHLLGRENGTCGAVGEGRCVAGGHPSMRTERSLQSGQAFHRGARARTFVSCDVPPAVFGVTRGDGDEVGLQQAVGVRLGCLLLARHCVGVRTLLRQVRESVVEVLGGLAHEQRFRVNQFLGQVAGVRIDSFAHRVMRHVLDASGDRHVVGTRHDRRRQSGHCRHCSGAPAVDGVARDRTRETREHGHRPSDIHALIARLGGGRDRDVVDALGGQ